MFPEININIEETQTSTKEKLGKVFAWDYNTNKYVLRDGRLVEADNRQAVKQWIHLLLRTQQDKYKIYQGTFFGLPLDPLMGNKNTPLLIVQAQLEEEIKEKAKEHILISHITNFKVRKDNSTLNISFYVHMKDGAVEEVNIDATK